MNRWKKILIGILVIALAAAGYGYYLFNKKPADVRTEKPNYEIEAATLLADFNKDETAANQKYLDKVIAVKGKVAEIKLDTATGQATVVLDSGDPTAAISCSFYDDEAAAVKQLSKGKEIVIKGQCTGKLMDIVLNKCSIEKQNL